MSTNQPEQGGGSSPTDASMGNNVARDVQVQHDVGQQQSDINELNKKIEELNKEDTRLRELRAVANFYFIQQFGKLSLQDQDQTQPDASIEPGELTIDNLTEMENRTQVGRFINSTALQIQKIQDKIQKIQGKIKELESAMFLSAVQNAAREQVLGDSGLVPSSENLRVLDFKVTVENGHIKEIKYKKEEHVVWNSNNRAQVIDEQFKNALADEGRTLLTEDGSVIAPHKLSQVISECLPEFRRKHRRNLIQARTDQYVVYANQSTIDPGVLDSTSEMFLQQAIYPPISLLLHLFAFGLQGSSYYAADQEIVCAHSLRNQDNEEKCYKGRPDASIRLSAAHYVVATMEIKPRNTIDNDDLAKCILFTSMSLVAYHEWAQKSCPRASKDIQGLKLPFVVGSMDNAELYVTSLCKNQLTPKVEKVYEAQISIRAERIQFVTCLAVLLKRAMTVVLANKPAWGSSLPKNLKNILSDSSSKQESSTTDSNTSTGSESGSISASYAETSAKEALISLGNLTNVMYPWHRVRWLAFSAKEERQAEFEFYRQQSPFYFVGHFTPDGHKEHEAVFCKVWKDGDRKTNRQEIVEEIEHLRLANKLGIPSPKVVEEASRLDLKLSTTSSLESSIYHVLAMTKAKTDDVTRCDVFDYAVSLIQAVRMLHEKAGMLHCDIKPANVSWNADEHKVLLLDFGHAQSELNAKSYLGTKGYEAPEVLDDKPHTRASDAYSVGITLQKVMESAGTPESNYSCSDAAGLEKQIKLVANLAQGLTNDSPEQRLTLDQAEMLLMSSSFQCSSNEGSLPRKKGRYHSQASLITP